MLKAILRTDNSISPLFLRLALGAVMFAHGSQKVLGLFGGPGFEKTIQMFSGINFPLWLTLFLMFIEFFGSLGLIFGLLTRPSALGIGTAISVCAYMNHLKNGFFMNWMGQQKGEGFEFHLLVVAICLALIFKGGGLISIDRMFSKKR